jgi:hypothetical protein
LFRLREQAREVLSLLGADASGQAILTGFDELANYSLDPIPRLAFAENDFGKPASLSTMQVNVRKAQVRDRSGIDPSERSLDVELAGANPFEQLAQFVLIHGVQFTGGKVQLCRDAGNLRDILLSRGQRDRFRKPHVGDYDSG